MGTKQDREAREAQARSDAVDWPAMMKDLADQGRHLAKLNRRSDRLAYDAEGNEREDYATDDSAATDDAISFEISDDDAAEVGWMLKDGDPRTWPAAKAEYEKEKVAKAKRNARKP